jgi:hypothetical protein
MAANSFTGSYGSDEPDGVAVRRLREHGARGGDAARPRLIFHYEALA